MLPAMPSGSEEAALQRRGHERLPSEAGRAEKGTIGERDARAQADDAAHSGNHLLAGAIASPRARSRAPNADGGAGSADASPHDVESGQCTLDDAPCGVAAGLAGALQRRRDASGGGGRPAGLPLRVQPGTTDRSCPDGAAGRAATSVRARAAAIANTGGGTPATGIDRHRGPGEPAHRLDRVGRRATATCTSAPATRPRPSTAATTPTRRTAPSCGTRSSPTRPPTRLPTAASRRRSPSGTAGRWCEGGSLGQETYALNSGNGAPATGWPQFSADSVFSTAAAGDLYGTGSDNFVAGGASSAGFAYGKHYANGGHAAHLQRPRRHRSAAPRPTRRSTPRPPSARSSPAAPTASRPARAATTPAPATRTRSRCTTPSATRSGATSWTAPREAAPRWPTSRATGSSPWSRAPSPASRPARSGPSTRPRVRRSGRPDSPAPSSGRSPPPT